MKLDTNNHPSGKYDISLLGKKGIVGLPKTNSAIGIDFSITYFVVLSNDQKIDNNKFTAKMEKN